MHRPVIARRKAALSIVSLLVLAAPARAQEPFARWVFVPVTDQGEPQPRTGDALAALASAAAALGIEVWPHDEAAHSFESRHSSERVPIGPDQVSALQSLGEAAVHSLASGDNLTALKELDAAAQLYLQAPDEFNREAPLAVLDLCLHRALAMLQAGTSVASVKAGMVQCRTHIPLDLEPNLLKHTNPVIRTLLGEVTTELRAQQNGTLEVRGDDGCQVRIDGLDSGMVSGGRFRALHLLIGTHRVSLWCRGQNPRVYTVDVQSDTRALDIDSELDAALHSRPFLWLRSAGGTDARLRQYARVVGEVLGDATVVLVQRESSGGVRLRRLQAADELAMTTLRAPSQVGEPWSEAERSEAIRQLREGPGRLALSSEVAQPPRERMGLRGLRGARERKRAVRAGYGLLSSSAVLVSASVALHVRARSLRAGDRDEYEALSSKAEGAPAKLDHPAARYGAASMATGVAGSAGLSGAFFFLAERYEAGQSNLWPLFAVSAAGVGLLGLGTFQLRQAEDACDTCRVERDDHAELGVLFASAGATLVTTALATGLMIYLPDAKARRRDAHELRVSAGPTSLLLEGSF